MNEHEKSVVLERQTQQTKPPGKYQVILLNDDFTPQDFVVDVLMDVFNKTEPEAVHIMLQVHYLQRGTCGVYTREVAETKLERVSTKAQKAGHPLKCVMEAL